MNRMRFRIDVKIFFILTLSTLCLADRVAYQGISTIKIENENLEIIHHHDWSLEKIEHRDKMIRTDQNPFLDENDYAFIECIDKKKGVILFKKPTPALTYLYISKNSKYIIGLSKIKVDNPYQFVLFDMSGKLLAKKHISPEEARLSFSEYKELKKKYPKSYELLKSLERIKVIKNDIYIDFLSMNMPLLLGEAWNYLSSKIVDSHLSKNFSESVTNWIYWYKEEDPKIELRYNNMGELVGVSLFDPKGKRFEIPIEVNKSEESKSTCH